ncbi:MAG: hypothetical protein ACUVRH_01510 [Candidatus Bipolaricaulia bacterium]
MRGPICPRCCGEHRVIEIDCPRSCPYLQRHERYQRERIGAEFYRAWLAAHAQLYRDGRERLLNFIMFLELLIYRYYRERAGGTDREVREGLEFLKRQLGPILLVEGELLPGLGQYLLEGLSGYLKESGLSREEALEGVEATLTFLQSFSEGEGSRRYLQGLLGHVARDFDLAKEEEPRPAGLIITPDQLRAQPPNLGPGRPA